MNRYAEIYSEFGLNSMIADTEKELIGKQKEYQDVLKVKDTILCAENLGLK